MFGTPEETLRAWARRNKLPADHEDKVRDATHMMEMTINGEVACMYINARDDPLDPRLYCRVAPYGRVSLHELHPFVSRLALDVDIKDANWSGWTPVTKARVAEELKVLQGEVSKLFPNDPTHALLWDSSAVGGKRSHHIVFPGVYVTPSSRRDAWSRLREAGTKKGNKMMMEIDQFETRRYKPSLRMPFSSKPVGAPRPLLLQGKWVGGVCMEEFGSDPDSQAEYATVHLASSLLHPSEAVRPSVCGRKALDKDVQREYDAWVETRTYEKLGDADMGSLSSYCDMPMLCRLVGQYNESDGERRTEIMNKVVDHINEWACLVGRDGCVYIRTHHRRHNQDMWYPIKHANWELSWSLRLGGKIGLGRAWSAHPRRMFRAMVVHDPTRRVSGQELNMYTGIPDPPTCDRDLDTLCDEEHSGQIMATNHLRRYMCADDPGLLQFLLWWFAFVYTNPGALTGVVVVLTGPHGCGKSMFIHALRALFGVYGVQVAPNHSVSARFNSSSANGLLVVIDEANNLSDQELNVIKDGATNDERQIEQKFHETFTAVNATNYILASNRTDGKLLGKLKEGSRRMFVLDCASVDDKPAVYWTNLHTFLYNPLYMSRWLQRVARALPAGELQWHMPRTYGLQRHMLAVNAQLRWLLRAVHFGGIDVPSDVVFHRTSAEVAAAGGSPSQRARTQVAWGGDIAVPKLVQSFRDFAFLPPRTKTSVVEFMAHMELFADFQGEIATLTGRDHARAVLLAHVLPRRNPELYDQEERWLWEAVKRKRRPGSPN